MSSEATTDVQVSHQVLRSFEEAKSLKAGDGFQGGEGDTGDRTAFACAPQAKQGHPAPIPRGQWHTGLGLVSLKHHSLKFSLLSRRAGAEHGREKGVESSCPESFLCLRFCLCILWRKALPVWQCPGS